MKKESVFTLLACAWYPGFLYNNKRDILSNKKKIMMSTALSIAVIGGFEYSFNRLTQKCARIKKTKEAIERSQRIERSYP